MQYSKGKQDPAYSVNCECYKTDITGLVNPTYMICIYAGQALKDQILSTTLQFQFIMYIEV